LKIEITRNKNPPEALKSSRSETSSLVVADMFLKAGFLVPLKLILPPGIALTDYMKEGIMDKQNYGKEARR
jgi:hypothetical protein